LFPELVESRILPTNGRLVFSASLGEVVLTGILYFAKDFRRMVRNVPGSTDPLVDHFYKLEERREMIALCDNIVATAPLTEETQHMISDVEFAVMKPTAVVINVGRGSVIDEAAPLRALRPSESRERG
jgi:lactate dehydrogenase-like 2-hydroxyacid dehydrogenase